MRTITAQTHVEQWLVYCLFCFICGLNCNNLLDGLVKRRFGSSIRLGCASKGAVMRGRSTVDSFLVFVYPVIHG